jgi:hypothetical protein
MLNTPPEVDDIWFPRNPSYATTLDWQEPEGDDLGPTLADKYLRASFWPFLSTHGTVDLASPAVLACEPRKLYGVLIEGLACVASEDIEKCRPIEVQYSFSIQLVGNVKGTRSLESAPTVVAVWPKGGTAPPVKLQSSWKANGELAVKYMPADLKVGRTREVKMDYEQVEPRDFASIGPPTSPRQLRWICRSTPALPSVEGPLYAGFWVTHNQPCYVRVTAQLAAVAEVSLLRVFHCRSRAAAFPETRSFALSRQQLTAP